MTKQNLDAGPQGNAERSAPACFHTLDLLPAPCWMADAAGAPVWFNAAWAEAGLPRQADAMPPALIQGEAFEGIVAFRTLDDHSHDFLVQVRPAQEGWIGTCTRLPERSAAERRETFLAQLGETLRLEGDPEIILERANRTLGEHLGALRVGYGEIDPTGEWLTLRADWTDGVPSNAGTFPLAAFGHDIVAENRAGRTFVCGDVRKDARIGPDHLEAFTVWGVSGIVAVPLLKDGRFTAVLSVQSAKPRDWSKDELQTIQGVADRTWEALERARAQGRLQQTQARQAFLLTLGDRLRCHDTADGVLREAVEMLGRQLSADRVGYAEIDADADLLTVDVNWFNSRLFTIVGRYPFSAFGQGNNALLAKGETVVIENTATSSVVSEDNRPALAAMGIRAAVTVPLVRQNRLIAVLSVQHSRPRAWTEEEVRLIEEVAERTWSIVERAAAEEALRKSEERLRIAIEGAEMGTWDYDLESMEGWWSPRTCDIFGIPYMDVIPADLRHTLIHPDDRERYAREVDEAVYAGNTFSIEYRIIRPAGDERWVVLRGVVSADADGKPVRATGIAMDTTERNLAEARLRESQAELEKSREKLYQSEKLTALGSLLAGVAHELNNPLAIVVANATLLEEEAEGTPYAADAQTIRRAAERCSRIVQTFLAMARQKRPERRNVDVNATVKAALDLAGYGLRTAGIEVVTEFGAQLPHVHADGDQLHQVLANLIVNAQQALLEKPGGRRLTLRTREGRDNTVEVEISDTGPGIPAEVQRRIFEPFFTTKPQGAGTGIGLSFSLGVIEAHGGSLELADSSADGATFRIILPTRTGDGSRPDAPEPIIIPAAAGRSALIVDDEIDLAGALAAMLKAEGYEAVTAGSGHQARALLADRTFDLVLSDLRMPDLDGPGLFAWLERERPELTDKVAFVTGDTLGAEAVRFLTRAGRPFMEKPFTRASLRRLLTEVRGTA